MLYRTLDEIGIRASLRCTTKERISGSSVASRVKCRSD